MGADSDLTTLLAAIATADDAYPHAVDLQVRGASLEDGRVDLDLSVLTEGKVLSCWRVACHGVVENRVALGEVGFVDPHPVIALILDRVEPGETGAGSYVIAESFSARAL